MTLTTETIKQWRSDAENIARRGCIYETEYSAAEAILALTAELLANREAQPVLWWTGPEPTSTGERESFHDHETGSHCIALYTAPPAPAVQDEIEPDDGNTFDYVDGWNACRAEMLAQTVSQGYKLPLNYLQGHQDGLEWGAQLAEANHPQTGDWLYDDPIELAKALRKGPEMPVAEPCNSPVIPDGWVACSERMPAPFVDVIASDGKQTICAHIIEGEWWCIVSETAEEPGIVTHWMPLPPAPEGGN